MKVLLVSADRTEFGGAPRNLGDALLTDSLAQWVRAQGHDVTIADFGHSVRSGPSGRAPVSGIRALSGLVRRSDAVLIGGGTLLQNDQPNRRFGGLPRLCLTVSLLAQIYRKPCSFVAVGADPVKGRTALAALRWAVRGRKVLVRDGASLTVCRNALDCSPTLAADASLLGNVRLDGAPRRGCLIALNRADASMLSESVYDELRASCGDNTTFLSMDQDPRAADLLSLPNSGLVACVNPALDASWFEAVQAIQKSEWVLASRMHALYIAALTETPMIAVGESPKVLSFAAEFRVPVVSSISEWRDTEPKPANAAALIGARGRIEHAMRELLSEIANEVADGRQR